MSTSKRAQKRRRDELAEVDDAFKFLTNGHESKALRGNIHLHMHLENLDNFSKEKGLNPDQLSQLVTIIERNKLSERVTVRLVKCLVPSHQVPVDVVLRICSILSADLASVPVQKLLVQWLVIVFDLIDDHEVFHSLYGVIFPFLQSEVLCPSVCQLLYLMTEKDDVELWRVKVLLATNNAVGIAPHVLSLLSVYKLYRPDLVAVSLPSTQRVLFKQTPVDRKWSAFIRRAQERSQTADDTGRDQVQERLLLTPARRNDRDDLFPFTCTVDTSTENRRTQRKGKVHIEHVKNFKQLLDHLEDLQVPSQLCRVLKDDFLKHVFALNADPVAPQRFNFWLNQTLQEEFMNITRGRKGQSCREAQLLDKVVALCDFLCETSFVVETFLARYLFTWNGHQHILQILQLVAKSRLVPFEKFGSLVLQPLKKVFLCSPVHFQCKILWAMTELVQNLSGVEWPRRRREVLHGITDVNVKTFHRVFTVDDEESAGVDTLASIVRFTDEMCSIALRLSSSHAVVEHMVLTFYETVCDIQKVHGIPLCIVPEKHVFYSLLFSSNRPTLSRVAQLLARFRVSLEQLRQPQDITTGSEASARQESLKEIETLNRYVLDACDILWRFRAFNTTETKSVFNQIDADRLQRLQVERPSMVLSLHCHQAVIGAVCAFLKEFSDVLWNLSLQTLPEIAHPFSMKNHRQQFLEYLLNRDADGFLIFLDAFIPKRHKATTTKEIHVRSSPHNSR